MNLEYHSINFLGILAYNLSSVVGAGTVVLKENEWERHERQVGCNEVHHVGAVCPYRLIR